MRRYSNQVWVTFALCDNDVRGALTLSCSLKRVFTTKKLVVMASTKISPSFKEALHLGFDIVFYIQDDLNTTAEEHLDFVKLSALTLTSFEKIAFILPTMIVLRNCDEFFEFDKTQKGGMSIQMDNQDASIMLMKPSLTTYKAAMENVFRGKIGFNVSSNDLLQINVRSIGKETLVGNETEMAIINLGNVSRTELAVNSSSYGLIGELAIQQWKEIESDYVQPLLQRQQENTSSSKGVPIAYEKEPIAIIGMSCRYPGANNLEEFLEYFGEW